MEISIKSLFDEKSQIPRNILLYMMRELILSGSNGGGLLLKDLLKRYPIEFIRNALSYNPEYAKLIPITSDEKFNVPYCAEFKKFSGEPTYYPAGLLLEPDMPPKKFSKKSIKLIEKFLHTKYHGWGKRFNLYYQETSQEEREMMGEEVVMGKYYQCYIDGDCLEVLTGIHPDYETFLKKYEPVKKFLYDNNFLPTSTVEMLMEGGCHLNFDLKEVTELGSYFTSQFFINYQRLMVANPSVIWSFLPPNDNVSSTIKLFEDINQYNKGNFFTIRNRSSYSVKNWEDIAYMEIRHFMMPRNDEEFKMHYDFCRALLLYVFKITANNKVLTLPIVDMFKYNYTRSVKEIKIFCGIIGFDWKLFKNFGKLDLLKERFTYGDSHKV